MLSTMIHRLVAHPQVYNWVQQAFGLERSKRRLAPHLALCHDGLLLDVGAGTGSFTALVPDTATYCWLDLDHQKLQGFRACWPHHQALFADATRICINDKAVDYTMCIALAHHLDDHQMGQLVRELARVTRERLIFLEPTRYDASLISKALWRYDRGSYPRTSDQLVQALEPWFVLQHLEYYAIYHHYLLCVATPGV